MCIGVQHCQPAGQKNYQTFVKKKKEKKEKRMCSVFQCVASVCERRDSEPYSLEAHARSFLTPWMKVCHG